MSYQLNLPQVDSNQVVETSEGWAMEAGCTWAVTQQNVEKVKGSEYFAKALYMADRLGPILVTKPAMNLNQQEVPGTADNDS